MGFNNYYKKTFHCERPVIPTKTMFPFFGFNYEEIDTSYDALEKNDDTATISGNTITIHSGGSSFVKRSRHDEIFTRTREPIGRERELEERFYEIQKNAARGKKDFEWDLKYISPSLSSYVEKNRAGMFAKKVGSGYFKLIKFLGLLFLIVLAVFIVCNVFGVGGDDFKEAMSSFFDSGLGMALPMMAGAVIWILSMVGVYKVVRNIKDTRAHREEYLKSMTDAYGYEAGKILQEYAILKGYDKI